MDTISFDDFEKVLIVAGTVLEAREFPEARKPAYQLKVDLGPYGVKQSSAQITKVYTTDELTGKKVVCVINFPPKKIAGFTSEILVTGFYNEEGNVVLTTIDGDVPDGTRLC
jgi:tRNA-binding protein